MTPQTQLTLTEFFEGKEIRMVNRDGNVWFPLVDLAEAWGTNRKTLDSITIRNKEVFNDYVVVWNVISPNQNSLESKNLNNYLKYVNEQGLYVLMGKVIAGRLKNPEAKERIIRFQRKVPELLKAIRAGEAVIVPTKQIQSPVDILLQELDIADSIIKRTGIPKEIAHSMALVLASGKAGTDLHCYATYLKAQTTKLELPEATQADKIEYDRLFSITKVAASLKLPIDKVRNVLDSLNIIYFENGIWKLTKHGEQYGKMFMVTPGYPYRTNQKCYIKYNPMLIDLLRKYFDIDLPITKVPE